MRGGRRVERPVDGLVQQKVAQLLLILSFLQSLAKLPIGTDKIRAIVGKYSVGLASSGNKSAERINECIGVERTKYFQVDSSGSKASKNAAISLDR